MRWPWVARRRARSFPYVSSTMARPTPIPVVVRHDTDMHVVIYADDGESGGYCVECVQCLDLLGTYSIRRSLYYHEHDANSLRGLGRRNGNASRASGERERAPSNARDATGHRKRDNGRARCDARKRDAHERILDSWLAIAG
jgi:hypothetical protein